MDWVHGGKTVFHLARWAVINYFLVSTALVCHFVQFTKLTRYMISGIMSWQVNSIEVHLMNKTFIVIASVNRWSSLSSWQPSKQMKLYEIFLIFTTYFIDPRGQTDPLHLTHPICSAKLLFHLIVHWGFGLLWHKTKPEISRMILNASRKDLRNFHGKVVI